ncbi:pyocin knob domain-containing protein [Roseicyclus amphidinii]|uniref:pyocin knob domain-containing protein n=1 Tax=Roseicyclus amphidinii TaxID=3034232 RepID=UPI0024E17FC9|nr:pyocin knob domain-containing protein [Roseicyclus sp. Amp-Y-6]
MTQEAFTPTALQTISGTGPYTVSHAYDEGALILRVVADDIRTALPAADFSVSPSASATGGQITLSTAAAALHAGKQLEIERRTVAIEQGWAGQTSREKGLETVLDWMTRAIQDALRVLPVVADVEVSAADLADAAARALAAVTNAEAAQANVNALLADVTPAGRNLLEAANSAAQRQLLGLGNPPMAVTNDDCNDAQAGVWSRFGVLDANGPPTGGANTTAGMLYTMDWNAQTRMQLAIVHFGLPAPPQETNRIFLRTRRNGNNWDDWVRIGPPVVADVQAALSASILVAAESNAFTLPADAWVNRQLVANHNGIAGASITGNAVALPAGTYLLQGYVVSDMQSKQWLQARLFNVTTNATIAASATQRLMDGDGDVGNNSTAVVAVVTLTAPASVVLQSYTTHSSPSRPAANYAADVSPQGATLIVTRLG